MLQRVWTKPVGMAHKNPLAPSVGQALSVLFALLCFSLGGEFARPQDIGHVFDTPRIQKAAQALKTQLEQAGNTASGLAEEHLDDVTSVAVRVKSGRAEVHKNSDDIFVVLSGQATLVTGGTVVNPAGTEEIRGDSISSGTNAELQKGVVVHIPRAVPHQLLLPEGETFVYVLVKIPR